MMGCPVPAGGSQCPLRPARRGPAVDLGIPSVASLHPPVSGPPKPSDGSRSTLRGFRRGREIAAGESERKL